MSKSSGFFRQRPRTRGKATDNHKWKPVFSKKADLASWPLNLRVCSYMRNPVISTHFCFETMPTLSHAQHHRHCNQLQVIFRAITIHPGPQTGKLGVALDSPLSPLCRPNPSACSLGSKSVHLSLFWRSSFQPRFHHHPCLSSLLTGVSTSTLSLSVYYVRWANL